MLFVKSNTKWLFQILLIYLLTVEIICRKSEKRRFSNKKRAECMENAAAPGCKIVEGPVGWVPPFPTGGGFEQQTQTSGGAYNLCIGIGTKRATKVCYKRETELAFMVPGGVCRQCYCTQNGRGIICDQKHCKSIKMTFTG